MKDDALYKMNSDGTGKQAIGALLGGDPVWPAVTDRIAFARLVASDVEIFTAKPDGTHVRQITHNPVDDFNADWHPTANKLLWTREADPLGNFDLIKMSLNGGGPKHLTSSPTEEAYAAWSPNGQKIVFSRFVAGSGSEDLWVMRSNGTHKHSIVESAGNTRELQAWWMAED